MRSSRLVKFVAVIAVASKASAFTAVPPRATAASTAVPTKLQEVLESPMPSFQGGTNTDTGTNTNASSMATRILDSQNILGECILYDDETNVLLWADIAGKQLHKLDLSTGVHSFQQFEKKLCAFALRERGEDGYLFAWEDGFQLYDADNQRALSPMSEGEDVNPKKLPTRLNDGRVDPTGRRFICGGFYGDIEETYMKVFKCEMANSNVHGDVDVDGDGDGNGNGELRLRHEPVVERIQVTNSICWSVDGQTMYLADSPTATIFKHDYDPREGVLSNRSVVRKYDVGVPDGSCTDEHGNIWNAVWRNGEGRTKVQCIDPSSSAGNILHTVELPDNTSQLTCCCFGGPDLDVLFISSAHIHLDREKEPHAGSIYAVKVGVKGRPEMRFR